MYVHMYVCLTQCVNPSYGITVTSSSLKCIMPSCMVIVKRVFLVKFVSQSNPPGIPRNCLITALCVCCENAETAENDRNEFHPSFRGF